MQKWKVFILLSITVTGWAQNLVPNPGFEQYFKCPGSYNYATNGKLAPGWYSPTTGTPDLFNRCSIGEAGVPENWAGRSGTYSGSGYAGIYMYIHGRTKAYREYLQAELTTALQAGVTYHVEFYYRLSSNSKYSVDRVGFLLSDSSYRIKEDGVFLRKPTFEKINHSVYNNLIAGRWNRFAFSYIATGGERYLTIGNFSNDEETRNYFITGSQATEPMLNKAAYFFIDDVKVIEVERPSPATTPVLAGYQQTTINENYVLQNVQFEFDQHILLQDSFVELNKVVDILKQHKNWKAVIVGHTDDVGSDTYNIELSMQRANSVAEYLIQQGIEPARLSMFGEGKQTPLIKGTDESSRAINRRVEVRFTAN